MKDSKSLKFESRLTNDANKAGIGDTKIVVLLKLLSNFWRTLEMPPINCGIIFWLIWSAYAIIDQGNTNLLEQSHHSAKEQSTGTIINQQYQRRHKISM